MSIVAEHSHDLRGVLSTKRFLDLVLAGFLMVLLSPVFLILAVLVASFLGRPVLFRQQRPGLHGKPFLLVKFRSMNDTRTPDGRLLPDELRITPIGRFLRSTSLDELPELLNVIRGEMSLVGPRPLLMQYLPRYSGLQRRRHEVLPGITGWAQVNGRNALGWERKFALDLWYVDHQSLWVDLAIMALTLCMLLKRDGIDEPGSIGASEFMGSEMDCGTGVERSVRDMDPEAFGLRERPHLSA